MHQVGLQVHATTVCKPFLQCNPLKSPVASPRHMMTDFPTVQAKMMHNAAMLLHRMF
jgi:hypothetical protein